MNLTAKDIKNKIRRLEDISLKIISDLVAYQIHKGPYDSSSEENYSAAENAVAEYVSENFETMEEIKERLERLGGGMVGMNAFADEIYNYYYKFRINFRSIKEGISAKKDISLKAITDVVAYKISQSPYDKGPEINYITAETFVAQYISKNFADIHAFKSELKRFGEGMKGIEAFSDLIYNKYYLPQKE